MSIPIPMLSIFIFLVSSIDSQPTLGIDWYSSMFTMNDQMIVHVHQRNIPVFHLVSIRGPIQSCRIDMSYFFDGSVSIIQVVVPNIGDSNWLVFFYTAFSSSNYPLVQVLLFRVEVFIPLCKHSTIFPPWSIPVDTNNISNYLLGVEKNVNWNVLISSTLSLIEYHNSSSYTVHEIQQNPMELRPDAIEILDANQMAIIAGESLIDDIYVPTLYLIDYSPIRNVSSFVASWSAPLVHSWQRTIVATSLDSYSFSIKNASSVAVNNRGDILFGVPSLNTVYHLRINLNNPPSFTFISSRIADRDNPSVGFGANVAWFDDTTAVILANRYSLDYLQISPSRIEIYDLKAGQLLDDLQEPYAVFPSLKDPLPTIFQPHFIEVKASVYGELALMDSQGNVYVISPADEDSHVNTNAPNYRFGPLYTSSRTSCLSGTSRVTANVKKDLLSDCEPCPENSYYGQQPSGRWRCITCQQDMLCPIGALAPIPKSYLENRSQATGYPKSTEASAFDDILLTNMFSVNFQNGCFYIAPMFWTLVMLGFALIIILTMALFRCSGKCSSLHDAFRSIFTHFDIINDGERWIGGIFSFSILTMIVYAALFTRSFLQQYPISESTGPGFTCDDSLRNSDFFTSMKPLNSYMFAQSNSIFHLMDRQRFRITLNLLSTHWNLSIRVEQSAGSRLVTLNPTITYPTPGVVTISTRLQSRLGLVKFSINGAGYIGGVQIMMTAPKLLEENLQAQEVNFAYAYRVPWHITSFEPYYEIELTPLVNDTKPLSTSDVSKVSGIWLPIIKRDDTRNFITKEEFQRNAKSSNLLAIGLTQSNYYISNEEKPLVKANRAIFKNILFASTCMELFGFGFLLMKLAIIPLCKGILRKLRPHAAENEENEGEDEEDEEGSEDDGVEGTGVTTTTPSEPAINEWYVPDKAN